MSGLSEAYVVTMNVIGSKIESRPLPPGINTCEAGDWTLSVNVSKEPAIYNNVEIPPFEVVAQHKVYLVIACFGPGGGMIGGGLSEGEFIDQMKALAP